MRVRSPAFALALVALLPQQVPSATPRGGTLTLPAGAVADLLETLAPKTKRVSVGPPWPEWSDRSSSGWNSEVPWRRWVELVRAESGSGSVAADHAARKHTDPARRAQLAVLARLQGRDLDAWLHLLACAADPGRVATLLPLFVPGVPQALLDHDGLLPDGVVLTPALPPCDDARAGLRELAGRKIELATFAIGSAHCSLEVSVEGDGLAVNLHHLAGGAARLSVRPPLPGGIDPGQLIVDWNKRPGEEGPIELVLDAEPDTPAPEEEAKAEHALWLSFRAPAERWPSPELGLLRAAALPRTILLATPRGDEVHLARCAEALAELFQVEARLVSEPYRPAPGLEPLVLHLGVGPSAERKLVQLLGLAEAFVLEQPGR